MNKVFLQLTAFHITLNSCSESVCVCVFQPFNYFYEEFELNLKRTENKAFCSNS